MANFYEDNDDLRFYVEKLIDWAPIVSLTEYEGRAPDALEPDEAVEVYTDVLRMIGEFVAEAIEPQVAALDEARPVLQDGEVVYPPIHGELFDQIKELELHGMCVPREMGGLNLPVVTYMLGVEIFARADVSVTAHHGFHGGMAMAALMYSVLEGTTVFDREQGQITETRFQQMIDEILAGEEWGSMDITEPQAGSDMAQLRCKGELDEDGHWTVTGSKLFITSGHGKWHFVIARTEAAGDPDDPFAGLGGLSMFLVPAFTERDESGRPVRTHTTIDAVEHKLGHHGSATVAISFDHAPAYLIGERGEGFKYMLMLMNNARVGVGFESLGLCEAAYRKAKAYAAERPSMGKPIDQHEMIADYLEQMDTEIRGIRAMAVSAAVHEELAQKLKLKLRFFPPESEEERAELERAIQREQRRSRHLTPLLKYLASEKAVELSRQSIQIHGGAGYMVEYGVEKLLRDAMVMPIYEGTSQIQALMAMKDNLLAAVRDPARFVRKASQARWRSVSARDPHEKQVAKLQALQYGTIRFLLSRLAASKLKELRGEPMRDWSRALSAFDPKRDFALAMLHAERLTRILADVAVAEELLAQSKKFPERVEILDRWLELAEPRCRHEHDVITTTGSRLLARLHGPEATAQQAAK